MAKINYLKSLLQSLEAEKLRDIMESYAKQDRSFEAFLLEQSGRAVETGKTYHEYYDELMKILEKCKSRKRGFVKVTRLKNAGMESFHKLLQSHFKNENFQTALWMNLALMEMMHLAILTNTRFSWAHKPYKSFEKIMLECKDQLDTCFKLAPPERKERPEFFKALVRCWWNERQNSYPQLYFESQDILSYTERDQDYITLKSCLAEFMEESGLSLQPQKKKSSLDRLTALFALQGNSPLEEQLCDDLREMDQAIAKGLTSWD